MNKIGLFDELQSELLPLQNEYDKISVYTIFYI